MARCLPEMWLLPYDCDAPALCGARTVHSLPAGDADGQLVAVGQHPPVLVADGAGVIAVRGNG